MSEKDYFETEDDFHYEGPRMPGLIKMKHICPSVTFGEKKWTVELEKGEKCPVCGEVIK
jgi:hypothetical protein